MSAPPLPILRGNLDLLVLKALLWGPMHGFQLASWLDEHVGAEVEVLDSALYQALYRLERRRRLRGAWGISDKNRRARFYEITDRGRALLTEETHKWLRYSAAITTVLAAPEPRRT